MSAYLLVPVTVVVLYVGWKLLALTFDAIDQWKAAARASREDPYPTREKESSGLQ